MSVSVPYKRRKPLMPCSEKRARRLPQRRRAVDRRPLTAAVAVNTKHWSLVNRLAQTELPIELSRDGRTKWNRRRSGLPKTHRPDGRAIVPGGKKADVIIGRARMRTTGDFSVQTTGSVTRGTGWRYCRVLLRAAGDATATRNSKASAASPCPKAGVCTLSAR